MKKLITATLTLMIALSASAALTINWNYAANLVDWDNSIQDGWLVQMYLDDGVATDLSQLAFDTTAADGSWLDNGAEGHTDTLLGGALVGATAGSPGVYVAFSYSGINASVAENSDVYTVIFNASTIAGASQGVILDSSLKGLGTGTDTYSIGSVNGNWQAVPEPATAMLLALGGGLAWLVRLKQRLG